MLCYGVSKHKNMALWTPLYTYKPQTLCDLITDYRSNYSIPTNNINRPKGWGCGYRTLQTICSWMNHNLTNGSTVPSIRDVQQILIDMDDKPTNFLGSRQWIGSFEVCLVIDKLYDIPCKIIHVNKGDELESIVETLKKHFDEFGSPIMMGGDLDCSSKGVMGVCDAGDNTSLLIVDPHYVGKEQSKEFLHNKGWVKWQPLKDFLSSSFYNLCLPQARCNSKIL